MKLSEWLACRTPRPPKALDARVRNSLSASLESEVEQGGGRTHQELLGAARSLLVDILAAESAERGCAHDLLAADALVTYAFEVASEDPDEIDTLAHAAMRSLGALAGEGTT